MLLPKSKKCIVFEKVSRFITGGNIVSDVFNFFSELFKWVWTALILFFSLFGSKLGRELLAHILAVVVHVIILIKMPKNTWLLILEVIVMLITDLFLEDRFFKFIPRGASPEVVIACRAAVFLIVLTLILNKFPIKISLPKKKQAPTGQKQ